MLTAEDRRPEGFGFRWTDAEPDDLAAAIG